MIVIPMAGLSSRFSKAGYEQPKYMLSAHGETLFEHAVGSFSKYFSTHRFLFIVRDVCETLTFVTKKANIMGIKDFNVVVLEEETRGQAETVALGLASCKHNGAITIFNIDTFRPNFTFPDLTKLGDGYLEVFKGSGENWSFAKPARGGSTIVTETAEKCPISDLCCTGLYHFSDISAFQAAYSAYLNKPKTEWAKGELYIAPLYNELIKAGKNIHYQQIQRSEVVFCGIPSEYDEFKSERRLK